MEDIPNWEKSSDSEDDTVAQADENASGIRLNIYRVSAVEKMCIPHKMDDKSNSSFSVVFIER